MTTEDKINKQIKDLQSFMKKQKKNLVDLEKDLLQKISVIEQPDIKAKLGVMLGEAKLGNLTSVQNIINSLQKDFQKVDGNKRNQ